MTNRIACAVSRLCSENTDLPVMGSIKTTHYSLLALIEFLQLIELAMSLTITGLIPRECVN